MRRALIVVDMQNDFIPGGRLAIAGGDALVARINRLMTEGGYNIIVATQDWHPKDHASFKKWPPHCVMGTFGAELHRDLDQPPIAAIFRKGMHLKVDSYSAFFSEPMAENARLPTGLEKFLETADWDITGIDVVGLAFDFCVKFTAIDAAQVVSGGFYAGHVRVFKGYTCSALPKHDELTIQELEAAGVEVIR